MTEIRFLDFHRPLLTDGDYEVAASVSVLNGASALAPPYEAKQRFRVGGPLQPLQPTDVTAVFPPDGSVGDHSDVLPHVIIARATLPWERSVDGGDAPGLALILVREDDAPAPVYGSERLVKDGPLLETVELSSKLLKQIAPHLSDLPLLTHVRETTDPASTSKTLREAAVILCPRLPGKRSTCLLVSVAGRYSGEEISLDGATTKLFVLKRWSFSCVAPQNSFLGLMERVKAAAGPLMPAKNLGPAGAALLPFKLRGGGQTVGWYRGPCVAAEFGFDAADTRPDPKTVVAADALIQFRPSDGTFDVSYAAAWEIGRLIGLSSKSFSRAISVYRRRLARQEFSAAQDAGHPHLMLLRIAGKPHEHPAPSDLAAMRRRLSRLEGLPFVYLVPDESALPSESLRFFNLDREWIEALVAGAFSLGRTHPADLPREKSLHTRMVSIDFPVCGFFLRSEVVSGWPGLVVEGLAEKDGAIVAPVRMERLSPTILIALFDRPLKRVDLHLHPESLHHGFARAGTTLKRMLRSPSGAMTGTSIDLDGCWRDDAASVLKPAELLKKLAAGLPGWDGAPMSGGAFFAVQTVEGVGRASVEITRGSAAPLPPGNLRIG